jgi:hypothetical protein
MKHVIAEYLRQVWGENHWLYEGQHGFIPAHFCESLVLLFFSVPLWVFCFLVVSYVLFVCKCILYYWHRLSTQLQLTNISYKYIVPYLLRLADKFKKEGYLGQTSNEWSDLKSFGFRTLYFKHGKDKSKNWMIPNLVHHLLYTTHTVYCCRQWWQQLPPRKR